MTSISTSASRTAILSSRAPDPVGPYSHAVIANGFVFTAGLIPTDPESGEVVTGGIQAQARRSLDTLKMVLEDAGSSLESVVRVTVYLGDLNDFEAMNDIYRQYFPKNQPARTTYQPGLLPLDSLIEIEAVAIHMG